LLWQAGVLVRPAAGGIIAQDRALALSGGGRWLGSHLQRLAALPAHGNRKLHVDQLFLAMLLSFFDPAVRSLRLIEARGNFEGRLDLDRLARSTTADALAVFDPACLVPLIEELRQRVPDLAQASEDLQQITRRIIAADGTYLTTLVDGVWALRHRKRNGKTQAQVRANVQLDTANWTPQVLSLSGDEGESEPAAFAKDLLRGVLYVVDRNFCEFSFLHQLLEKDNDFVLRIRRNAPAVRVIQTLELSAADAEAGVVSDEIVELTGRGAPAGGYRRVIVQATNRQGQLEEIRLLSNLLDETPARVIAAIYKRRWQRAGEAFPIELFFKWLKTWAQMDHLLSSSRNGITFQLYVAVIAVLLMYVQSGRRVSRYALATLGWVAQGEMTLEQALAVIAKFEREKELDRRRQARRRARKKLG
jgi:hypothetical protein